MSAHVHHECTHPTEALAEAGGLNPAGNPCWDDGDPLHTFVEADMSSRTVRVHRFEGHGMTGLPCPPCAVEEMLVGASAPAALALRSAAAWVAGH